MIDGGLAASSPIVQACRLPFSVNWIDAGSVVALPAFAQLSPWRKRATRTSGILIDISLAIGKRGG